MKKLFIISAIVISITACNSNSHTDTNDSSEGLTNPSAIDTTKHPSGMENSSVTSTDTAAMNMQNSVDKGNAAQKKN